eukprot:3294911-Amphidinium_carterae.1
MHRSHGDGVRWFVAAAAITLARSEVAVLRGRSCSRGSAVCPAGSERLRLACNKTSTLPQGGVAVDTLWQGVIAWYLL